MRNGRDHQDRVLTVLQDPLRSRLYAFVRRQRHPVTREDAAAATGISHKLAAFHLDKLVAAGLLTAGRRVPPGPRGPGRAPKAYALAPGEWQLSVPPRRYPLLAEVLTAAVTETGEPARAAASGSPPTPVIGSDDAPAPNAAASAGTGTSPHGDHGRCWRTRATSPTAEQRPSALRNCPFAQLPALNPELICRLNRELIAGLLEGLGASPPLHATLLPPPAGCCVQVRTTGPTDPAGAPTPRDDTSR